MFGSVSSIHFVHREQMTFLINLSKLISHKELSKLELQQNQILSSKARIYSPENVAFLNYVLVSLFENNSIWPN